MDTRGAAQVRKRLGGVVNVAGFAPEKLARYIRLTGGAPSLTGKDPVGHMLFIKHERPDLYRRTFKFLNVLDFVNFRLTGRMVSTFDSILTSWVTDNRAPNDIKLDARLCAYLGIPPAKIPEPVPCTEILGEVDAAFASEIGIPASTPVVAGAIDVTASAVGAGTVHDGDVHLYLGTSSWLGAHVPFKKTDILSAIGSVPCAIPSKYLMIALQANACGNLNFLVDKVLFGNDPLPQAERPEDVYGILDRMAASVPAGANGLMYTPWIYGERAPVENQSIRAGIHNLSLEHSRSDLVRAIFEGVALNTRWILKPVERFLGHKCESIAAVGGGANSEVWCRIFADVLGRPVRQIWNPIEANVRGSAFIAAAALGKIAFDDVAHIVKTKATFEPRLKNRPVYDLHFSEFKRQYRVQKGISKRLNAFHHS
jgi:xylulokinase